MPTPEEMQAEIAALKAKNEELLGEKKAAKAALADVTARLEKIEADAKRVKDEAEAEAAKKAGDWERREAQLKAQHDEALKKKDAEIAALTGARDKLVIENGLKSELTAAGVAPQFLAAVESLLKARGAKVEIVDGAFVGKIADKPLAEFVREWAAGDEGKHFIAASNSGGAADPGPGKTGTSDTNPFVPKGKPGYNLTRRAEIEAQNPALAARLKREAAGMA